MKHLIHLLLVTSITIVLLGCESTPTTPAVITERVLSAPVRYSFLSNSDSIETHTHDTLSVSAQLLAGYSGDDLPFFWLPSIANISCPVGDTFYVRIEGVPKSVAWGSYKPINKDTCQTVQICDTLDCGEYLNTYVHRMTADEVQSGVIGVGGIAKKPMMGAFPYYANINYTFGVVDSLYFETDSIEWISEEQRGYELTRVVLSGKTNAHRVEVYTGGFGMGDTEPLTIESGEFNDTFDLYMSTNMDDYCKTTLFIFGTHNGYEKVEISTAD